MIRSARLMMLGAAALLGCASRPAPATQRGAASLDARPAPLPVVTRALDADPPSPGQDAAGWLGLDGGTSAAHEHAGHAAHPHGAHGHGSHAHPPHATHGEETRVGHGAHADAPQQPDAAPPDAGSRERVGHADHDHAHEKK